MNQHSKSVLEAPLPRETRFVRHPSVKNRPSRSAFNAKSSRPAHSLVAVRREKLLRAKRLLQNAQYPSEEVIESVAKLLARNWRRLRKVSGHLAS